MSLTTRQQQVVDSIFLQMLAERGIVGVPNTYSLTTDQAGTPTGIVAALVGQDVSVNSLVATGGNLRASGTNGVLSDSGIFQSSGSNTTLKLYGNAADGATAVNAFLDTAFAYATAGSKLFSIRNNGVEKAFYDKGGFLNFTTPIDGTYFLKVGTTTGFWPNGSNTSLNFDVASTTIFSLTSNSAQVNGALSATGKISTSDYLDISGTPGNGTANTSSGRAAIASGAQSCVVSNTKVNANSIILLTMEADGTGVGNVVLDSKSAGTSFTVKSISGTGVLTNTTAATRFSWLIIN